HYSRRDELDVTEAMLILSSGPKRNFDADISKSQKMDFLDRMNYLYPDRAMTFQEIEIYLRDYKDEVALFEAQGITRKDIFENTLEIADKVAGCSYYHNLGLLPRLTEDPQRTLRELCYRGLKQRNRDLPEYRERLEDE